MKKISGIFKKFIKRYKEERQFRYVVIIVSLTFIAFAVNEWSEWRDKREMQSAVAEEQTETAESSFLMEIWEDSKLHFAVFGGLTAALVVVQCRNAAGLKEKGKNMTEK